MSKDLYLNTDSAFWHIIQDCKNIFLAKNRDYGTSWRFFRPSSITDQIYIKLLRIRSIEEKKFQLVEDKIPDEWKAIINYGILGLWIIDSQKTIRELPSKDTSEEELIRNYDELTKKVFELMKIKNHDYDEAWRKMRPTSMTDLSLVKINRIKELEDQPDYANHISNIESNYMDIINYAVFASIILESNIND